MAIWGGCLVILVFLLSWNRIFPSRGSVPISVDANTLKGIQSGDAPWKAESANLASRLKTIGIEFSNMEGQGLHLHPHVDIFVNGTKETVPANIGIAAQKMAGIHSHDTSGVIHIESSKVRDFTIGEIFDVWGVRLTKECVGGYCTGGVNTLKVYANGKLVSGDPRDHVFKQHEEIAVVYGAASSTAKIPSSYDFGPNQ